MDALPRAQRQPFEQSMGSMSLFELPVSKGARAARVTAVVLLNLILAGAGIAMILSYLGDRAEAARGTATAKAQPEAPTPQLDVLEPDAVDVDEVKKSPTKPAKKIAVTPPTQAGSKKTTRPKKTPPKGGRDVTVPLPRKPPGPDGPTSDTPPKGAGSTGDTPPNPAGDGSGRTGTGTDDNGTDPVDDGVAPDGTIEDPADEQLVEFSAAKVRRVVDRHRVQLQRCYKAAAKSHSLSDPLDGRVDVQFVINPDGTASNVTPVANTTGSRELATCVSKLIESWQFPSPGAEDIAFVWPFVFKAP